MGKENCGNCHFQRNSQCRRNPPVAVHHDREGYGDEFPSAPDVLWCGEYQPRSPRRAAEAVDISLVFDGPPGPEAGCFVEAETADGCSMGIGEWRERDDGLWALDIKAVIPPT